MSRSGHTTIDPLRERKSGPEESRDVLCLVIVWAPTEPSRVGEVLFPVDGAIFGRTAEEEAGRVELVRQRPGLTTRAAPLEEPSLSRRQLRFQVSEDAIDIESLGRRELRMGDVAMKTATVREGDVVEIEGLYLFYCARRPRTLPEAALAITPRAFGFADEQGIVGESAAAWALRGQISFFGKRNAHVLVTGPSGAGKELVAQAIHRLSSRSKRELVARNAATFPAGLIDAELFGNMQNYPNPGMPERPGLVGQADGGTLFLDEIGELPSELQAHLLRLLDGGEYQRLGEAKRRVADVRVVAATNRNVEDLKEDLAARLALRVHLPGLDERREDIPLVARHLLLRAASKDPQLGATFFDRWDGTTGEPRLSSELCRALVLHGYATHVRELEGLLWRAAAASRGSELALTEDVRRAVKIAPREVAPVELTAEDVRAALARHGGVKDKAWRDLRLPSRHALHRLMRKLNIPD